MSNYGPDLTPKMKAALEREIAGFNKKEILAEIEREAIGNADAPSYAEWSAAQLESDGCSVVPLEANPDLLSEDEAVNLTKPNLPDEIVEAKQEIDDLLSYRELQVWRLVMRQGISHIKAASLLHISVGAVRTYLQRAKAKIDRHFNQEEKP